MRRTSEKDNLERGVFCGVGNRITYAKALRRGKAEMSPCVWSGGAWSLETGDLSRALEGTGFTQGSDMPRLML